MVWQNIDKIKAISIKYIYFYLQHMSDVAREVRGLILCLSIPLLLDYVYVRSEGSD